MDLVTFLAKSCVYAQEHIAGWEISAGGRYDMLQCTSFQVACFLAQNTVDGNGGVEWDIVHKQLVSENRSEEEWKEIILTLVSELGGLK